MTNTTNYISLGSVLKQLRGLMGLTTREVEEATGIDCSYLSYLENHKLKGQPSVNIFYKLSSFYNINIEILLFAAGVIKELSQYHPILNGSIGCLQNPVVHETVNNQIKEGERLFTKEDMADAFDAGEAYGSTVAYNCYNDYEDEKELPSDKEEYLQSTEFKNKVIHAKFNIKLSRNYRIRRSSEK